MFTQPDICYINNVKLINYNNVKNSIFFVRCIYSVRCWLKYSQKKIGILESIKILPLKRARFRVGNKIANNVFILFCCYKVCNMNCIICDAIAHNIHSKISTPFPISLESEKLNFFCLHF